MDTTPLYRKTKAELIAMIESLSDAHIATCLRVRDYHFEKAKTAEDEDERAFREGEACGAEDCSEALADPDGWFSASPFVTGTV